MRILVIEDDARFADILRRGLEEQLFSVEVAHDGESGRHLALSEEFDLILLDLMLPVVDGMAVCHAIRAANKLTPIIMLTARDGTDDRIMGLDMGADDYIVKPFSIRELFARIRALMRRVESRPTSALTVGSLRLDPGTNYVQCGEREIPLTAKEFAVLHFFMQHPNAILSRTEILEKVWDSNYDGLGNVVDVYVNYLRRKLEEKGEPRLIGTVRGRGYVLKESPDES